MVSRKIFLTFVRLPAAGGRHPRNKTNIVVTPMHSNFDTSMMAALDLFYNSNVGCLTHSSGFMSIRKCTEMFAKPGNQTKTVRQAWSAVGVGCRSRTNRCTYSDECCGTLACRKTAANQTNGCYDCIKAGETCLVKSDCCGPHGSHQCLPVTAGSSRKVCVKSQ